MRRSAALAIVLTCGAAGGGAAALAAPMPDAALAAAAFATPPAGAGSVSPMSERVTISRTGAPVDWRSGEVPLSAKVGLRLTVGDAVTGPRGRPLSPAGAAQPPSYELSVVRRWPEALTLEAGRFGVDVSPHAGVGVTSYGGLAEAGAEVQLSPKKSRDSAAVAGLKAVGVRDGAAFGDKGRWYLFAAASGRSVGLNMLRNDTGWAKAGWSTDQTSALVGDAQLGVGWRKGDLQSSVGFVHREVKGLHMIYGQETIADSLVAFSFSVKPGR